MALTRQQSMAMICPQGGYSLSAGSRRLDPTLCLYDADAQTQPMPSQALA
jgi:hypothetical protein